MKLAGTLLAIFLLALPIGAQPAPTSATVPVTLDHNRIIIDVYLPLPDGTTKRVRGWVDTGNPELWMTEKVAKLMGLAVTCDGPQCTAPAPVEVVIGDMKVSLAGAKQAKVLQGAAAVRSGLSAEITIPSTVLRNFDVIVDYPNREFTLAAPSSILFEGLVSPATIDSESGIVRLPVMIGADKRTMALDLGSSFTFVSSDVVSQLHHDHPQWPEMTGSVGAANLWGTGDEADREILSIPQIRTGAVNLTDVAVGGLSKEAVGMLGQVDGTIGANALLNYRVGLDYAHKTAFFDKTSKFSGSDMDVIGLTLRPEPNNDERHDDRYVVAGVARVNGIPAVSGVNAGDVLLTIDKVPATGGTMGQVWSLLGGHPGDVRTLTMERDGKQFTVRATVRRFLRTGQSKTPAKMHPARVK